MFLVKLCDLSKITRCVMRNSFPVQFKPLSIENCIQNVFIQDLNLN